MPNSVLEIPVGTNGRVNNFATSSSE